MKLINANIKSKKELVQRLIDGEVFFLNGSKIYFNEEAPNPFVSGVNMLFDVFNLINEVKKEQPWHEDENNFPVHCFVSDNELEQGFDSTMALIINKQGNNFVSKKGLTWKYAKRINEEKFK